MMRLGWALALGLAGCGYTIGPRALYAHSAVRVAVAENATERRTHEFDLTAAVVRTLQASGIAVNAPDARAALHLEILDITEPALVEGRLDVVTVGAVAFRVQMRLVDVATGQELVRDARTESASFTVSRGESRETARQEVLDRLARWVATRFEKDW